MYIVLVGLYFIFNKQKHEMMAVSVSTVIVAGSIVFCSSIIMTIGQHWLFEY